MLNLRTKQINTYGKRTKRVIPAPSASGTAKRPGITAEIMSIFEDMPAPPPLKNVAARMKKRENELPKPKPMSPKVVGLHRKKRLSPVLSPIKKKVTESKNLNSAVSVTSVSTSAVVKLTSTKIQNATPKRYPPSSPRSRPPLSTVLVPLNITASPITMQKRLASGAKSLKSKKPVTSLVNIDITVLDDKGLTISTERRVSKGRMDMNTINKISASNGNRKLVPESSSESEEEDHTFRLPRRRVARKNMVVSSDGDTDTAPSNKLGRAAKSALQKRIVEVCIPPAPYKITRPARAKAIPLIEMSFEASIPLPPSPIRMPSHTPSPVLRPRRATPIKKSRKGIFQPPSPPSAAALSDLDLSIDFSVLNLDINSLTAANNFRAPKYLKPLLMECHQETCGPHNFSTFIERFPYDPIVRSEGHIRDMKFKKIGEASYSEVFGIGNIVLKIIPLHDESKVNQNEDVEIPAPTDSQDVCKEIIVTRALGEVYGGFVKLLKTYVVKGRYPEVLLRLWDEYNEQKGSESIRPGAFKVSQTYAIIVLPNGGSDLEAYTFNHPSKLGWRQACSIFWQVAKSLAHAEYLVSFEHRDLHWGQILVKNLPSQNNALRSLGANHRSKSKSQRVFMDDQSHGVAATIIDLGLSRMDAGDGGDGVRVHWTPFDDEVFMGEGDYQFDIYRMMKEYTRSNWDGFHPFTNVLWLHYLLSKLLRFKGLKNPSIPRKIRGSEGPVLSLLGEPAFTEKDCYDCLVDIEDWLGRCITATIPSGGKSLKNGKGRRKPQINSGAAPSGPARAGEIVAYGVKKGWIQALVLT